MKFFRSAVLLASMLAAVGCQQTITTSDGTAPAPRLTAPTPAPVTARANALAITFAPKPADTNGNLLPDTLQVTAYLFAKPHPTPLFVDGSMNYAIYRPGQAGTPDKVGAEPLRSWAFGVEQVRAMRSMSLAGPCHELSLSLLDAGGTDVLPVESVDLVAWFQPADGGETVWMRGVRGVQFPRPGR